MAVLKNFGSNFLVCKMKRSRNWNWSGTLLRVLFNSQNLVTNTNELLSTYLRKLKNSEECIRVYDIF
jgi:hypothetical protein